MIYLSGRQCVQLKVNERIGAYNHGGTLFVKGIYDALQGIRSTIQVVGIELYGKLAAIGAANGIVPASADTKVGAFGHQMHHLSVVLKAFDGCIGSVCRMIVDNYHVELKRCLLCQGTPYGIGHGFFAVAHRYDYRCFITERDVIQPDIVELAWGKIGSDGFQMLRAYLFHLYLNCAL